MHILPIFAAPVFAAFLTTVAADGCQVVGKLNAMLSEIDSRCSSYQLTTAGQTALNSARQQTRPLGGEACMDKGKAAMQHQLRSLYPSLAEPGEPGNSGVPNRRLCDAIARYLNMVSAAPLVVAKQ